MSEREARAMGRVGKVWTASIAYVALAVGAGLSIMYNVVDTMTVRGQALDIFDVITAIAAPGVVVLMVEMFVAGIWVGQPWHVQGLRWLATLAIGGVAMRTSWTHGHDFMARRGQAEDVATLWPLAIDLLAIMATALILAGRRPVASDQDVAKEYDWSLASAQSPAVAKAMANLDDVATWDGQASADDVANNLASAYATVGDEASDWLANLANHPELDTTSTPPAPLPQRASTERTRAAKYDKAAARVLIQGALDAGTEGAQIDAAVAEAFGVSTRTARRLRAEVSGQPVSGPPDDEAAS